MKIPLSPLHNFVNNRHWRKEQQRLASKRWHFWFAWRPVRIVQSNYQDYIAWFETVARIRTEYDKWKYGPVTDVLVKGVKS